MTLTISAFVTRNSKFVIRHLSGTIFSSGLFAAEAGTHNMRGRGMRGWVYAIVCAVMLLMMAYPGIAQQTAKVSPKGTKFLLYTPPNYSEHGEVRTESTRW